MCNHGGSFSVRKVFEKAFAAIASAAILTSVGTATVVMCFPGLGAVA